MSEPKQEPMLTLEIGATIYRACCMEELQLEPGRIAEAKVLRLNRINDAIEIQRIWSDGTLTTPTKTRASWLAYHGWRNTPELAARAGVIYLTRCCEDAKRMLADAETALAALSLRVGTP